ncbi:MAG: response regulator, partial [Candidatus Binatia bacterium]
LVVDDNPTQREVLSHQLATLGMEVESVEGGAAALARLLSAAGPEFQLAFIDVGMSGMNGVMLARAIRATAAFEALPLVLLGDYTNRPPEDLPEAVAHLYKPLRRAQLVECLNGLAAVTREPRPEAPAVSPPPEPKKAASRGRVLLAEDNPVNQKVARLMLERLGYEVTIVADGLAAVEAVSAGDYDAVLMDCQMPRMDGLEAARAIRQGATERIPIVALTASAYPEDRERCRDAGMDDYLAKPVKQAELESVLRRWIPRDRAFGADAMSSTVARLAVA